MSLVRVQLEEPNSRKPGLVPLTGLFVIYFLQTYLLQMYFFPSKYKFRLKIPQQVYILSKQTVIAIFCFDKRKQYR
ncbi:hypothetical protein XBJ1_1904 [Xenorhabdus bovienii SS-2004]|uniref:Uncharacterized protein n=1 Tax=Xenorhabdus bovienii (strain SS-2004) TaxID=406818 RepID=D3V2R5_XENBS|nr:hypothetical protein XBJ1_1904 [Xenorhabdus bovienii SS-2004]